MEQYFKGKLLEFELLPKYENEFTKNITVNFPPNAYVDLAAKYFEQGKTYFSNFSGLKSDYEIIGVEKKYEYQLDKYNMVGIIDLEVKHKDGHFEIIDHKSKSSQTLTQRQIDNQLKKGEPEDNFVVLTDGRYMPFELMIQLYNYCKPFKELYGEFPKYLNFNMFKIGDWYQVKFNEKDYQRSLKWMTDIIQILYNCNTWNKGNGASEFWCDFICGQSTNCKYSNKYIGELDE